MASFLALIRELLTVNGVHAVILFPYLAAIELLLVFTCTAQTPTRPPPQQACPPLQYKYLRSEEDYRYLYNPACRSDPLDSIKYISLKLDPDWFASVGGEVREDVEYSSNPRWGQQPQGPPYLLQRFMVHTDLHLGQRVRVFTQIKSGLENGREGGPRIFDKDNLDVNQAFVDIGVNVAPARRVILRVGRQELSFGSRRYISARDGPNVRQTFDGVQVIVAARVWNLNILATKPVETNPGSFDDSPDHRQSLWGTYATHGIGNGANVDIYYLGLDRKRSRFEEGTGREQRHSVGARLWGKRRSWDEDIEVTYQWGRFNSGPVRAWAIESETGYTFSSRPAKPRLALKANTQSGDRKAGDGELQTFNPLFPRGVYNQLVDLNGHVNSYELDPTLIVRPVETLSLTADWDVFWRQSLGDGLYSVGGFLIRPGTRSQARYIGTQPSLIAEWRLQRHLTAVFIYTHFFPGQFLRESGPSRVVNYGSVWLDFKF